MRMIKGVVKMTTQFIIFPNGKNSNQLKNQADKILKALKKSSSTDETLPKKTEILNTLAKESIGLSYNKAIETLKPLSPYVSENKDFIIPFSKDGMNFSVKLTIENEFAVRKQYFDFFNAHNQNMDAEFYLCDVIFEPKFENIEKLSDGWKLKLTYLKDNPDDEECWVNLSLIDDGLLLNYYIAEYNGRDGYDVLCVNSIYVSYEELQIDKTPARLKWKSGIMKQIQGRINRKALLRFHMSSFKESMEKCVEIYTVDDLVIALKERYQDFNITEDSLKITNYGFDKRNEWNTYMVELKEHGVLGFMNSSLLMVTEEI
jgi:hypothetical protein